MPNSLDHSLLGRPAPHPEAYAPELLYPIARAPKRQELGIGAQPPFFGADLWTAYELSWLTPRGKPVVAIAHVTVPCESPNIIESKSFKLYLNSFSGSRFAAADEVLARLRADIAEAAWRDSGSAGSVGVRLTGADAFDQQQVHELDGVLLDRLDIECTDYTPQPSLLSAAFDEQPVEEVLTSNLLKSNCPVTRAARLGFGADPLLGPADRPGRAAALPGELPQARRVPRAVRGAHLHGHPPPAAGRPGWRCTRATPAGADWTSTRSAPAIPLALPPNVRTARQ